LVVVACFDPVGVSGGVFYAVFVVSSVGSTVEVHGCGVGDAGESGDVTAAPAVVKYAVDVKVDEVGVAVDDDGDEVPGAVGPGGVPVSEGCACAVADVEVVVVVHFQEVSAAAVFLHDVDVVNVGCFCPEGEGHGVESGVEEVVVAEVVLV